jgi:hypothetical protein
LAERRSDVTLPSQRLEQFIPLGLVVVVGVVMIVILVLKLSKEDKLSASLQTRLLHYVTHAPVVVVSVEVADEAEAVLLRREQNEVLRVESVVSDSW